MIDALMPNDIKNLLREAAGTLKQSADQELAERLLASLEATDILDWDRRLIATMFAKAGKMDECRKLIKGIPVGWQRADALRAAGEALRGAGDTESGAALIGEAVEEAKKSQEEGDETDQQCASGVLVDIAEFYCGQSEFESAEKIVEAILPGIRHQRALDRLRELRGDPPEEEATD